MRPEPEILSRIAAALAAGGPKALETLAGELRRLRPMDRAGALGVAAREGLVRMEAPAALAALQELAGRAGCLACGTCCRTSSPTLYLEDLPLIQSGGIKRDRLYVLRPGEMAYSARLQRAAPLTEELIKLKDSPGLGCVFVQDNQCAIYASRPLQCRWLRCWDHAHAGQLRGRARLTRAQLWGHDPRAIALAAEYDQSLPAGELARALTGAREGDEQMMRSALEMMEKDHRLRAGAAARYGYSAADLDSLWGRPAPVVALGHGLKLGLDEKGLPRLFSPA